MSNGAEKQLTHQSFGKGWIENDELKMMNIESYRVHLSKFWKKTSGGGVPSTPPPSNPLHVLDSHKKVYTYVSSPALTFARKAREGAGWGVGNSPREYFRNFEKALFI